MHSIFANLNRIETANTPKVQLCRSCHKRTMSFTLDDKGKKKWICQACGATEAPVYARPVPLHFRETKTAKRDYGCPTGPMGEFIFESPDVMWFNYAYRQIQLTQHDRYRIENKICELVFESVDWQSCINSIKPPQVDWVVGTTAKPIKPQDPKIESQRRLKIIVVAIMQMSRANLRGYEPKVNYARLARLVGVNRALFAHYTGKKSKRVERPLLKFALDVQDLLDALILKVAPKT